jgi:hypothetical protein
VAAYFNDEKISAAEAGCVVRHISGAVWSVYMRPKNFRNVRRRRRPSFLHISRSVRS